ncbi:branched-chain amino acid ABC transporter permease [Antarctobacter heliothermus]|uniref:Branched-chain amino acid ABC transporter permease n=1 Tax=Antarctobacter heliothermus TaxID=74033 RepID=A0A222E4X1_9RHOB|nr:branched-chain amino acid ABC transporter permease [Antarctobacter heliothermus]ASP21233.1 branched-chain amino acid ABC transporter permease [Antarctobacter heliothermus]MBT55320.1 branched-chain amino acid ABC transporter permease [Mameliella sp.]|tara:strand:- start:3188 stop:4060 length:873 start_codon:yes stop_codon:yes gene_type:complete
MIEFLIYMGTIAGIWAVLAISLNLQFGITGLVNFGQVLPFAIGAYGAGIATRHELGIPAGVLISLIAAPVFGALVVWPARRMAQDYWALITLGLAEIFRLLMMNVPALGGGVYGLSVTRMPGWSISFSLTLALLAVAYVISERVIRSPLGRMLNVIREDEILASTLGRDPFRYQRSIVMLSWVLAGLAGNLYAHVTGYVHESSFMVIETFVIWTAMILGGAGRTIGVIAGAFFVQALTTSTRFIAQWTDLPSDVVANLRLALVGLVLVLMIVYRPAGIFAERRARHVAED